MLTRPALLERLGLGEFLRPERLRITLGAPPLPEFWRRYHLRLHSGGSKRESLAATGFVDPAIGLTRHLQEPLGPSRALDAAKRTDMLLFHSQSPFIIAALLRISLATMAQKH